MPPFPGNEWMESVAAALSDDQQFSRTSHAFAATIRFDFGDAAYALTIDEGDVSVHHDPKFVAWDLAVRGSETTWEEMLSAAPSPPYHDLLGAWLRGDLTMEGDLETAIKHLRPLKRMLAVFQEATDE